MDQSQWLTLLQKFDDYEAIKYPKDESGLTLIAQDFKRAHQLLDERFALGFQCDVIQDASFHGYLRKVKDYDNWLSIRFSHFGRFIAVHGTPQSYVDSLPVAEIIQLLEDMNFVYVPMEILELPYEGPNNVGRIADDQPPQWWDRYFSYA